MWSYDTPKEEGWYYVNLGDVVTHDNFECDKFKFNDDELLVDTQGVSVKEYNGCYKFMLIDINNLNGVGNSPQLELDE